MRIVDRAKTRIGQIKADRSTEMGVAGHQAAMAALRPQRRSPGLGSGVISPAGSKPKLTSEERLDNIAGALAAIEPGVIDRHKPTKGSKETNKG